MKNTLYPVLTIAVLFGLLVLLATLQYQWVGQISDAEQVRLKERIEGDTKRFADDFDREVRQVYHGLRAAAAELGDESGGEFSGAFEYWLARTPRPDLVGQLFYYRTGETQALSRYERGAGNFVRTEWPERLRGVREALADERNFKPLLEDQLVLALPVYEKGSALEKIVVQTRAPDGEGIRTRSDIRLPDKKGFLLIALDRKLIEDKILPELAARYFAGADGGDLIVSVTDGGGRTVFSTHDEPVAKPDASAPFFSIAADDLFMIRGEPVRRRTGTGGPDKERKVVFSQRNTVTTAPDGKTTTGEDKDEVVRVDISPVEGESPKIAVFESRGPKDKGVWTLSVRHTAGSLEEFIGNTRRRNLAVSFGILGLLAVSIALIFLWSQRARTLARRQLEFVSSVSHEFRTPLAVIYSAGENLSDGLVDDREKIAGYGSLIKREGRKLSGMVEQILEFAGAGSGRRRYEFRPTDPGRIVAEAIEECRPFIEEHGFSVEQEIADDLPTFSGDEQALTQAVRNLVSNSVKYGGEERWLRVAAKNGGGTVRIEVEDRGRGIAAGDRKRIFEPFYRAGSVVEEQISGNGLGLSLVKQIVDAHNGRIEIESETGKGTKFTIHLPVEP